MPGIFAIQTPIHADTIRVQNKRKEYWASSLVIKMVCVVVFYKLLTAIGWPTP